MWGYERFYFLPERFGVHESDQFMIDCNKDYSVQENNLKRCSIEDLGMEFAVSNEQILHFEDDLDVNTVLNVYNKWQSLKTDVVKVDAPFVQIYKLDNELKLVSSDCGCSSSVDIYIDKNGSIDFTFEFIEDENYILTICS